MRYLLLALAMVVLACVEDAPVAPKVLPVDFPNYGLSCSLEGVVESVRLQVKNTGNTSVLVDSMAVGGEVLNSTAIPFTLTVGETKTIVVSPAGFYLPGFTGVTTRTVDVSASGAMGNFTKQMVFKGTRCP